MEERLDGLGVIQLLDKVLRLILEYFPNL